MRRALLVSLCLAAAGLSFPQRMAAETAASSPPAEGLPRVQKALQDGKGIVWAIAPPRRNEIQTFDGQKWKAVSLPFPEGTSATPLEMALRVDGSVVCVWRLREGAMAVTRHLGSESSILVPEIAADITKFRLAQAVFADSHNRIWIMAGERQVYRVDADGKTELAYEITEADRIPGQRSAGKMNPLVAVEDGRGRVWIWTREEASNYDTMRGVLIFEGSTMHKQEAFPGLEGDTFTDIARRDERTMWMATWHALFTVSIEDFKATPVALPSEGVLSISRLCQNGGDLYVVGFGDKRKSLWRLRDGRWTRAIDLLWSNQRSSFWLPAGKGLIVGVSGPPWYVPEEGAAVRLDWQNGFPLANVTTMIPLKDGRYLIADGTTVVCQKLPLPPTPLPAAAARVTELPAHEGLAIDANGHVWYQPQDKRGTLAEWDGTAWRSWEMPASITQPANVECMADEQGRLWLMPRSEEVPLAYLDLATGKWSEFPQMTSAFESVRENPPRFIETRDWPPPSGAFRPVYHGKQIAFLTGFPRLVYFDGEKWRRWDAREILEPPRNGLRQPSFDEKGNLLVRVGGALARWNGSSFEEVPNAPAMKMSGERQQLTLPDGTIARGFTAMQDNRGVFWYLQNGQLLRATPEMKAPVFAEGETNPFALSRMLSFVYVDPSGTAFVGTEGGTAHYFMIAPKHGLPNSSVAIAPMGPDGIKAKVQVKADGKAVARWQLDDEPWRVLEGESVQLDSLPSGEHTFRTIAIDGELQMQGKPAEAKFTIKVDQQEQLRGLVDRLADPDFAKREAAVVALRRQPVEAAKMLRVARASASEDQRWWIDAALQEIESAPVSK